MATIDPKNCGAMALLLAVFGKKPSQTSGEFIKEVGDLRNDAAFLQECRDYAIANPDRLH
jgi:hypothetical protein